jgi:hypothetical protein
MLTCKQLPHDCPKVCKTEKGTWNRIYAASLGCSAPTPTPQVEFDCPGCGGAGCDGCDKGKIRHYRCPNQVLAEEPETRYLINWFFLHFEKGRLPGPGGLMDQPAAFVAAMEHLGREYNRIESKRIEKELAEMERRNRKLSASRKR